MERLKKRRDFLKVQKGRRAHTGLFVVQALPREDLQALPREEERTARVGFTVSKRVSPLAVKRNRIRRRLKEAVRLTSPPGGMDYVIVARIEALTAPFSRLTSDLDKALRKAAARHPDDASALRPYPKATCPKATCPKAT